MRPEFSVAAMNWEGHDTVSPCSFCNFRQHTNCVSEVGTKFMTKVANIYGNVMKLESPSWVLRIEMPAGETI